MYTHLRVLQCVPRWRRRSLRLGVGRRLAFDEWRGRLWVVCPKCARWNLAPLDDRLERIEALARVARDGPAAREHRSRSRCCAGSATTWCAWASRRASSSRDGATASASRPGQRERAKVVVPLTLAAVGLGIAANVAVGGSFGFLIWNIGRTSPTGCTSGMVGVAVTWYLPSHRCAITAARPSSSRPSTSSTPASCRTHTTTWQCC